MDSVADSLPGDFHIQAPEQQTDMYTSYNRSRVAFIAAFGPHPCIVMANATPDVFDQNSSLPTSLRSAREQLEINIKVR